MSKEIELHEMRCPNCKALWDEKNFKYWGMRAYMTWKCPYCRTLFCTEGTKDAKEQRMAEMEAFLEGFSVKTGMTTIKI